MFAAIEAGGTKINVAVGAGPTDILASARLPTKAPAATIASIFDFFDPHRSNIRSFGVASFGPVRLDTAAEDWGHLLTTPKNGWSGASFVHPLVEQYGLPVALDTDVNAAAMAEHRLGALRGVSSGAYITVGTGVGAGFISEGAPIHGLMHPEFGHVRVLRTLQEEDNFFGSCPYHGDCLEGLAAGPAIKQRWGNSLSELPLSHPAHALIADYLGQACATLALTLSSGKIVIGGGVSQVPGLHAAIAARMRVWLGGYLSHDAVLAGDFVVAPALGDRAGITGAFLLAQKAVQSLPISPDGSSALAPTPE